LETGDILKAIRGKRVLVIGDLMVDEWLFGDMERISPEAPCPVVDVRRRERNPGGAANAAANVASLGGFPSVMGVVGDDEAGDWLNTELSRFSLNGRHLVWCDETRKTTVKRRVVVGGRHVIRLDEESRHPVNCGDFFLKNFRESGFDAVLVSDYDKGVARGWWLAILLSEARKRGIPVAANPKPRNATQFSGADFLSFNEKEAAAVLGESGAEAGDGDEWGFRIARRLNARAVAVTRGSMGVILSEGGGGEALHIPARRVKAADVAGAGDTFIAAAALCLAAGLGFRKAAEFGNLCAAAAVGKSGVAAVTAADVAGVGI
jgi:D-beta-D-heptose 7-phosphate kinase/D-beta-D-heptose 1-phosphate adenosyltransferase